MEGNGRRLAWIAIALSAVALVVAIGGRAQPYMGARGMRGMMQSQAWGQQGPQGQFGQPGPQSQFDQQGPQGQFGRGHGQGMMGRNGQGMMGRGGPGQRGGGAMPFFMMPFMLIGKLIKLAAFVALIWLGIKLFRGRKPAAPAASAAYSGAAAPSARPGPEQPPYTDETQQL